LNSYEAAFREWSDREAKEISELLPELFKAHGVDEGDWIGLTLALARAHVAAFSFEKARRGPKTVWEEYDRAELRLAVDELIECGSATSVLHACQILARKPHWTKKLRSQNKHSAAAQVRQYHKAELRFLQIAKEARAYDQWRTAHPEEVAELEREIANKLSAGNDSQLSSGVASE
jgi:HD-GYP domain-containing protein (c-di-GMP phosphodiesterase class II)